MSEATVEHRTVAVTMPVLTQVDVHADGATLVVTATATGGSTGTMVTANEPGVADAVKTLAAEWQSTSLIATEGRWLASGRQSMPNRAERLAYTALDIACVAAFCEAKGLPLADFAGGHSRGTVEVLADAGTASIDADLLKDIPELAAAGLAGNAFAVHLSLAACGGIAALRRIAATARALNLDVRLKAFTGSDRERDLATELAGALGFDVIAPSPGHVTTRASSKPSRIRRVRLRRINLPITQTYVSFMYLTDRVDRTIVEVETEDGFIGLGEASGTEEIFRLGGKIAKSLIGQDALDRRGMARRFAHVSYQNANGRSGWQALSGLELACWDITARRAGVPLADLLGRADPSASIPAVALLPAAIVERTIKRSDLAAHFADLGNAERVVQYAVGRRDRYGFETFKYKSVGNNAAWDLAIMRGLRRALGPNANLRFDPNASYGTGEAARLCTEMLPLGLEFFEDPTEGIEGLARLRHGNATTGYARPIASNMVLINFDHFAPTVRRDAIDVLLADLFHWGGVETFREMAAAAEVFGLQAAIHSFYETGIATAANVHIALGLGLTRHAADQGHQDLADDVVSHGSVEISGGHLLLPPGPGLGVALDEAKMQAHTTDEIVVTA